MPRKPKISPQLAAAYERRGKAQADCERYYRRMARAFKALEKARQALARHNRTIRRLTAPGQSDEAE